MALVVGLDVGTQGAKAILYNTESRQVVSRGAAKYDVIKSNVPGRAEQHPSTWIEVRRYGTRWACLCNLSAHVQAERAVSL